MRGWLAVKNFEYEALEDRWAVLRLLGEVEGGLGVPAGAALLIDREGKVERHCPLTAWSGATSQADGKQSASGLLWRVSFAVPLEVVEYPRSLFSLTAQERAALALPSPALYAVCLQENVSQRAPRTFGFGVRRQL